MSNYPSRQDDYSLNHPKAMDRLERKALARGWQIIEKIDHSLDKIVTRQIETASSAESTDRDSRSAFDSLVRFRANLLAGGGLNKPEISQSTNILLPITIGTADELIPGGTIDAGYIAPAEPKTIDLSEIEPIRDPEDEALL